MSPEHCRAARAMAGLSVARLARESHLSIATVERFEAGRTRPQRATLDELRSTFETHGVLVTREGPRWVSAPWTPGRDGPAPDGEAAS